MIASLGTGTTKAILRGPVPDAVTTQGRPPSCRTCTQHENGEIIMTSPTSAPAGSPTIGQAVGQAEASLTRLLTGILAERGTSRETYLGVQRLTSLGGHAARDD